MYNLTESIENIYNSNDFLNEEIEILHEATISNMYEVNDLLDEAFDILGEIYENGDEYYDEEINEAIDYVYNILDTVNYSINETLFILDEGYIDESLKDKLYGLADKFKDKSEQAERNAKGMDAFISRNRQVVENRKNEAMKTGNQVRIGSSRAENKNRYDTQKLRDKKIKEANRAMMDSIKTQQGFSRKQRFYGGLQNLARKTGRLFDRGARKQNSSSAENSSLAESVQLLLDYVD